jgi:hypothetical protein
VADADCTVCPELLTRLGAAAGGLRALAVLIESEMVEPTMPWRDLLPTLALRARNLAEQAEGRY